MSRNTVTEEDATQVSGDVVARVYVRATEEGEQFRFHFSRRAFDDLTESSLWYRPEDLRSLRSLIEKLERRVAHSTEGATQHSSA